MTLTKDMKHPHPDIHKACPRGHTEGVLRVNNYYYCDLCYKEDQARKKENTNEDGKQQLDKNGESIRNQERPHVSSPKESKTKS